MRRTTYFPMCAAVHPSRGSFCVLDADGHHRHVDDNGTGWRTVAPFAPTTAPTRSVLRPVFHG